MPRRRRLGGAVAGSQAEAALIDPLLLRGLERLIAVLAGAVAIYLGFRLFLAVPGADQDGRAELSFAKDSRIVLTRIGPGVFFALFGAAIIVSSYYFAVRIEDPQSAYAGFGTTGATTAAPPVAASRVDAELARDALAFLTERQRAAAEGDDAAWNVRGYREAKLAILSAFWAEDWGDPREFRFWLRDDPTARVSRPAFERALQALERGELP